MNPDILIRLIWAASLIVLGVLSYAMVNRLILRRASLQAQQLALPSRGSPAILYFTTPTCLPCKTVQRPAIRVLQERMGDRLVVVEVDATIQPELASQWGVMSVPTTFIIDPQGQPRHVNHGVATAERLLSQIQSVS